MIDTRKTILVVDDQAINRTLLVKILDPHYHCIEAANGQEGLTQLKQHQGHIAAVLTDIRMPVMDGYAFVRAIRQDTGKVPDMPVLVITEVDLDQARKSPWPAAPTMCCESRTGPASSSSDWTT